MTNSKKSRWGIGIAVAYAVFFLAMVSMVIASRFQRSDLVTRDYYEQEIKYQEQIDRLARTAAQGHALDIQFDAVLDAVSIQFPTAVAGSRVSGKIALFRPANAAYDKTYDISLDAANRQILSCDRLPRGMWRVKIAWRIDSEEFYTEEIVRLEETR